MSELDIIKNDIIGDENKKINENIIIIKKNSKIKCKCGKALPSFGFSDTKKKVCCKSCKEDNMISLGKKKCQCGKSRPTYNLPNNKKAICCKLCKTNEMVNVIDKKCKCGRAIPIYGYINDKKVVCCKKCKDINMIDLVNRNKMCECGKTRATLNYIDQKKAKYCIECAHDGMVNVIDKKCTCGKSQPTFGLDKCKPKYCIECKTDEMIDIRNIRKKCIKCNKKRANYDVDGSTKAKYCFDCKSDTMVDVTHIMCKGKDGKCPINQRGNPKYDNYCTSCFSNLFPNDERTLLIKKKSKEIQVRNFINLNYDGFIHDEPIWTNNCDCSIRRRIDHRKLIGNTLLVIETDENQHKQYNVMDEEIRYDDLYMAYSGKWIYIRFNPDNFKNKNGVNRNPSIKNRLEILKKEIDYQIKRIENNENKDLVEIVYLFYDGYVN